MSSVVAPLAYATVMPRRVVLVVLVALLSVAVAVELGRHHIPSMRRAFDRAIGSLLREHERTGWSGATWLVAVFIGVVALAPAPAAIAAMWSVSMGDAAAAVVGRSYSAWMAARDGVATTVSRGSGKTSVGSVACAVVTAAGTFWIAGLGPITAIIAGCAAALAERPRGPLDDNVRVAITVAAVVAAIGVM